MYTRTNAYAHMYAHTLTHIFTIAHACKRIFSFGCVQSATLHEEAETLSELCQSLHDQWLQCDTAVAQQEDSVVERIQQLRLLLRQRQQSTEQELDMKIDALRQAGSKDALASLKRIVELHLSQAKRLLEEYGENAKTAPSDHAAKVQTHAQVCCF